MSFLANKITQDVVCKVLIFLDLSDVASCTQLNKQAKEEVKKASAFWKEKQLMIDPHAHGLLLDRVDSKIGVDWFFQCKLSHLRLETASAGIEQERISTETDLEIEKWGNISTAVFKALAVVAFVTN